ncbi:calcium/sodium antiporter [Aurantiacibacter poecillastricola]|uniref:calcium/sodium antiporter n=1 Tax=Aurantiacibacter poecillastricola TaxID=3064385 RepID=UPI00273D53CC|nr:calcium/sodium antiporter [Aurantiacibacter sp. 219JJ12-13]MDP5262653.1 calcium/sodium antiporter [Aurantiacibacter sp. 219JJ12-13]
MPSITDIAILLAGLVLLMVGGDVMVRGAVRLAERLGLSAMLIGLVVVGLGTSSPELAASVQAAIAGSPGLAIGNIVGSNLANLLLVLGASALIAPMLVERNVLWRDGGVGLAASLAFMAASFTLGLDRIVATIFMIGLAAYIYSAYRQEKVTPEGAQVDHSAAYDRAAASEGFDPALVPHDKPEGSLAVAVLLFVVGLAVIVGGGTLLVNGAVTIASTLGVSEAVIGLTIVAVGTSAPELVTSVIAAIRGQSEIALGNVLGSNIYNLLFIGGVTGLVAPGGVPEKIAMFDLPLATLAAFVVMIFAYTGGRLSRREGGILVVAYLAYTGFTSGLI